VGNKRKFRIRTNSNDPQFYIRLPVNLKEAIEKRAQENGRNRNTEIAEILSRVVEHEIAFHPDFITIGTRVVHLEEINIFDRNCAEEVAGGD